MTPLYRRGRVLLALAALLPLALLASSSPVAGQEGPPPAPAPEKKGTDSIFAGMVEIPAGKYKIGIDKKALEKLYEKHPNLNGKEAADWWELLLVETPEHMVELPAFAIDRYEVTNAQYYLFLEKACRTSVFVTESEHAIEDLAVKLYGPNPTEWEMESLYILNKAKLLEQKDVVLPVNKDLAKTLIDEFNKDLPEPARVKEFGNLPEPNQIRGWCRFKLPKDMALTAYTRVMPETWRPDGKPTEAQLSLPVQFISGEDAEAFAEWAGKHVPTEEEWETAARGPDGFLYPWGNEWDCEKERNRILWKSAQPEPRGPAPVTLDGPIAVDRLGESMSPFGCFHMLGNVTEWTSSVPTAYKESDSKWKNYGQKGLRVMRGCSYGDGADYKKMELLIRNTARIIHGYGNGIDRRDRWQTFGFRCAKVAMPAAENMSIAIARLVEKKILPPGMSFDAANTLGVERLSYDAAAKNQVFVTDAVRFVGVAPLAQLDFPTAKQLMEASGRPGEKKDTAVPLALVQWSSDLKVEGLKVVEPAKPEEPAPAEGQPGPDGGAPPPDGGSPPPDGGSPPPGGEQPGKADGEGGDTPPAEKPAPEKPAAEKPPAGKPAKPAKPAKPVKPAKPAKPAKPGEKVPPEEPVAPPQPTEEKELVSAAVDGYVICLYENRLALYEVGIKKLHFRYWLFGPEGEQGPSTTEKPMVEKLDAKDFARSSTFDPATGMLRLQIPLKTSSESSKDVFALRLNLRIPDAPAGEWRGVEPPK